MISESERSAHQRHVVNNRFVFAVHESGHAVASWAMQREIGDDRPPFDEIAIHSTEDMLSDMVTFGRSGERTLGARAMVIERYSIPMFRGEAAAVMSRRFGTVKR